MHLDMENVAVMFASFSIVGKSKSISIQIAFNAENNSEKSKLRAYGANKNNTVKGNGSDLTYRFNRLTRFIYSIHQTRQTLILLIFFVYIIFWTVLH